MSTIDDIMNEATINHSAASTLRHAARLLPTRAADRLKKRADRLKKRAEGHENVATQLRHSASFRSSYRGLEVTPMRAK